MNQLIQSKLSVLPDSPGCYLYKDITGRIIYVGKAKNLKNRVRSYFRRTRDLKTEALISETVDFEFIVTESNIEALLLEINLIKEQQPKYNIMLKDDKSYPFIKITNEEYPRLLITRQIQKDGGRYFGPYPDIKSANEIKRLLDRIFPFKKCSNPPEKVCFYYHIQQCRAHTVCQVDKFYFEKIVQEVSNFLKGKDDRIVKNLQIKMEDLATQLRFDRAAEIQNLLQSIATLRSKQHVISKDLQNRDVFGYAVNRGWMCVQVFFVRQGKLIERDVNIFPHYNSLNEDFLTYIGSFYRGNQLLPDEVLIPLDVDEQLVSAVVNTKIIRPQRGEKKQLVNLASKNAHISLQQKIDLFTNGLQMEQGVIESLGLLLGIPTPVRIEAFDNSNTMGTNPVSAMVVFVNGEPSKKDYRRYKISTVEGANDCASIQEVLCRRYTHIVRDGMLAPDLIIIDGGKGQVSAAQKMLENLGLSIPIAGLKKNNKHHTHCLLFGNPLKLVDLPRNSKEFLLLQRIQAEVHRFAIKFHREVRSKNSFSSQLDGILGLGPKRKKNLLRHFKSISNLQKASISEIVGVGVPKSVAESLYQTLHGMQKKNYED